MLRNEKYHGKECKALTPFHLFQLYLSNKLSLLSVLFSILENKMETFCFHFPCIYLCVELLSHVVTQHFEHCASALNLEKSVCVDLRRYCTFQGRAARESIL